MDGEGNRLRSVGWAMERAGVITEGSSGLVAMDKGGVVDVGRHGQLSELRGVT